MKYLIGSNDKKLVEDYLLTINYTLINSYNLVNMYAYIIECSEPNLISTNPELKIIRMENSLE